MARCVVLGANGFLGSHLTDALADAGHYVRAFDRFSTPERRFSPTPNVEVVPGDFLNRHDIAAALKDVEYVFHFISTTTPITSEDDPLIDVETNVRMSVELLQECVSAKVKKIIFASTGGSIYGVNSSDHVSETQLPLPISPYAIGKLTIEHYLHYFETKFGVQTLVFRISNPYGERQSLASRQGVIPIFLQHIARNEPITVLGDGSMVRDYIYVKDVARMVTEAFMTAEHNVYNLGSGKGYAVNELVKVIRGIVDKPIHISHAPVPATFVQKIVLDTSRFITEFHDMPQTDIHEGILATWQYVQAQIGEYS